MPRGVVTKKPAKVQELRPELPERLLDVDQLAERFGIGRTKVFELKAKEGLPYYQWGQVLRFDPGDVAIWLQGQKQRSQG